ncbi:hypothetical protein AB0C04_10185 [Micromonospora sp. NPDC048909]|uniref:hypothetical protein n=1 Tax=Micromonospora sp. NPDC048909 TaxID=3155643 RepID=UPI0033CB3B4C
MTAPSAIDLTVNAPAYPRGGDSRRRMRLRHLLLKRRRWSNELDALLADGRCSVKPTIDVIDIDRYHAAGLDLDWEQRERLGRAAG